MVHVKQPGVDAWDATTTHISGRTYKVTLKLNSAGDPGSLDLVVAGVDKYGGNQETDLSLSLR